MTSKCSCSNTVSKMLAMYGFCFFLCIRFSTRKQHVFSTLNKGAVIAFIFWLTMTANNLHFRIHSVYLHRVYRWSTVTKKRKHKEQSSKLLMIHNTVISGTDRTDSLESTHQGTNLYNLEQTTCVHGIMNIFKRWCPFGLSHCNGKKSFQAKNVTFLRLILSPIL